MSLTEQCRKDFETWYYDNDLVLTIVGKVDWFWTLPNSMRFGTMVDFFESVGIYIEILVYAHDDYVFQILSKDRGVLAMDKETLNTRKMARIYAIAKANEIYNHLTIKR